MKEIIKKKKLICFDLDNTLAHTNKTHIKAYTHALKKHKITHLKQKQILEKFGMAAKTYLKELLPNTPIKTIHSIIKEHDKKFSYFSKKYSRPITGVKTALKTLSKNYELAIVTNCNHKIINKTLKSTGINPKLFKATIGNDDVLHPKPAPDEIYKAEKLLHLKAHYMVGDTTYDIIAGKKAKVKSIAVLTGLQDKKTLQKYKPYKILKSIKDLPTFLEKENSKKINKKISN